MGKLSAVGHLTRPAQPFILLGVDKWVVSCMAAITRHWWRRLVNAYDVKAGMVCLQCNNCVIHTWAFRGELLTVERYRNLSFFTEASASKPCGKARCSFGSKTIWIFINICEQHCDAVEIVVIKLSFDSLIDEWKNSVGVFFFHEVVLVWAQGTCIDMLLHYEFLYV